MRLFYLFFGRAIERRIAAYQNDLIKKHCDEVNHIYHTMRGWRHDYHNHIQTLLALCGDAEKTKEYLIRLNDDLTHIDTVMKTGNVMIDAILNSKLSLIKAKNITVDAKAVVPGEMSVSEVELCVIIGNLLDNAMEACVGMEESWIRIFIGVLKEQLYISVSNSVKGKPQKQGRKYLSTKGTQGHGFGLARIDSIVKKYDGYLNRQSEEGVFATEVMLPL